MAIEKVTVAEDRFASEWGITVNDYMLDGKVVDLQDIATRVSEKRALAIEDEVEPMQNLIDKRSERLEHMGVILSTLTNMQSQFSDDSVKSATATITGITLDEANAIMKELTGAAIESLSLTYTKAETDGYVQRLKTMIDEANNTQQKDMTRLQALVDRRDESFTTATSVMSAISDTRSTLMKNL